TEIVHRVVRNLSVVGLSSEVLPLLPSELSGGMRKRVGIARALSVEPEMLLFDEPTAGLDPTNSRLVADLILQLRHGVCDTTIVVTHDIELARTVADRVAVLIDGRFGAFVPVALAAFLGMVYALGARARLFEARYTIHADFTEVGGLVEGATVRLAGVQIGRVVDVRLAGEPGGKVRVELNIARRYSDRIRKDSVARVETQGLLGDRIVEITGGT